MEQTDGRENGRTDGRARPVMRPITMTALYCLSVCSAVFVVNGTPAHVCKKVK